MPLVADTQIPLLLRGVPPHTQPFSVLQDVHSVCPLCRATWAEGLG